MSSLWNNGISISIFGESHGKAIGVVLDNLPSGETIDMDAVLSFMARRAPKDDLTSTQRREKDIPVVLSGVLDGRTTGAPLAAIIENSDAHSSDYSELKELARPGHADYTGYLRYHGFNDVRGSGHFSGRLTAPLTFAGAVCAQILERRGIYTAGHIYALKGIHDTPFDTCALSKEDILELRSHAFPVIDQQAELLMRSEIERARLDCNSIGGVVEICTIGFPAGVGSPMFDGLENAISSIVFGIPAVKGLEFGIGFEAAQLYGSQNNDEFYVDEAGTIKTKTNHHGGILGGISTGMPISLKIAFKPTPSISKEQKTVNFLKKENAVLTVRGRHDPCIVPRAVPAAESAVNIALLGQMVKNGRI